MCPEQLEYLNNLAQKANESTKDNTDIMNLPLNIIIKTWANINSQVFSEIVLFLSNIQKYKEYIDEENANSFIIAIKHFLEDFIDIFKREGRLLYIGITFILISILIYFIGITS